MKILDAHACLKDAIEFLKRASRHLQEAGQKLGRPDVVTLGHILKHQARAVESAWDHLDVVYLMASDPTLEAPAEGHIALHGEGEPLEFESDVYLSPTYNPGPMIFVGARARGKRLSLYLTTEQAQQLTRHLVDRLAEAAELSEVK